MEAKATKDVYQIVTIRIIELLYQSYMIISFNFFMIRLINTVDIDVKRHEAKAEWCCYSNTNVY